jgi:hypothetical protein
LWSVQVGKLLIMQSSPASCHFFHLEWNWKLLFPEGSYTDISKYMRLFWDLITFHCSVICLSCLLMFVGSLYCVQYVKLLQFTSADTLFPRWA